MSRISITHKPGDARLEVLLASRLPNFIIMYKIKEVRARLCMFVHMCSKQSCTRIVTDLTVETLLQAFRRFNSHKSLPRLLISIMHLPTCLKLRSYNNYSIHPYSLRACTERKSCGNLFRFPFDMGAFESQRLG